MGYLHVSALELTQQFHIVVARHTEGRACSHHAHHQAQHPGRVGSTIHEIPQENGLAAFGVAYRVAATLRGIWRRDGLIAQVLQERPQFITTAVHIADDVERSVLVLAVAPDWLALHHRGLDLFWRGQDKDMAKAFTLETAQRAPQLLALVADDVCSKGALRTLAVALLTELLRQ